MTPKVLIPESIEAILWRVLAKSPADRPSSAEELIAELDAAEASVRALESGLRLTVGKERPARSWRTPALVAAVLLVLLGFGALLRQRSAGSHRAASEIGSSSGSVPQSEGSSASAQPSQSLTSLENSSADAPLAAPTAAASAAQSKHSPRIHPSAKPVLQKKGNERYGRFD
jgi:hypothetical protein